ncbi:efflux RND transporter periplasmic adaptor subunit [Paracoccus pacificus]|uniref:Efflux RND transporter periplasmic adaptor subunit n=1 Tax=Paracoccus pacificus TaxID=1463598 RepID=A0ABW4RAJ8_9RHOB
MQKSALYLTMVIGLAAFSPALAQQQAQGAEAPAKDSAPESAAQPANAPVGEAAAETAPGTAEANPAEANPAEANPAEANPAASDTAAANPENANNIIPAVTVATARMAQIENRIPTSGTLVPRQEVQVYPQVSGFEVIEILVEAGDKVSAGQPLARLNDLTSKAQLAQAEAEFLRAKAGISQANSQVISTKAAAVEAASKLERAQRLQRSGNGTQASLDQAVSADALARASAASAEDGVAVAEAALAQAEAAREIAQINLDRTVIKAPVAGLVETRTTRLGAIAGSGGEPFFTIIANSQIEVAAEVIETALGALAPGDAALMRVAGVGEIAGKLRLVPATVSATTRLGIARVTLDDDPRLRTGLFASGWIVTDRRQAITVPASAVLEGANASVVQVVKDGVIETRPVKAGILWQDQREIVTGLNAGETVVARAGAFFSSGDRINPTTESLRSEVAATTTPAGAPQPDAADTAGTSPDDAPDVAATEASK